MAIRNVLIATILYLLTPYFTNAQSNYTLINDATVLPGCHCYQLTPDQGNQGGGVYQNNTINLNNSFDFTFNVYLGSNGNSGADGMTFILTPNITAIGAQGGGLGYSGLAGNSLAVEYDTYQNGWDPPYNHIALEYDGQVEHPTGTIMGPYPALPGNANMDNGVWHTTEIVWNVNTHTYTVYFDGNLIFAYSGNIVTNYFGGNPVVNWGWAGSTGGSENTQQFCVLSTSNWTAGTNYQTCDLTVQFADISTTNVASVQSWKWNFGDPASGANNTSGLQNPTHTFTSAGTYSVSLIITDISGCPDTFAHTVTINPPISFTPTLTDPLCNGASNGDISLATTGGFGAAAGYGGYEYTWSGGGTSSSDVGLTAGTYNVTCTDGVCTTTASYTLTQPTALTATTSSTAAPCGGTGTATITISGGTPPYQNVTWDGITATPGPNTFTAGNQPVGTVVANFKDANGCSALLEYTQNIIQLPCGYTESTSATNVTCFGGSNGSVTLSVTGQTGTVTVIWDNSSGTQVGTGYTVTNLPAGVYTYHYSDTKPTNLTGTVTVTQPGGALTVGLSTVNTTCSYLNNGSAVASVTANGTSPYTYAWSAAGQPNSPTATGLSPGSITVTVTDANGCTGTATGTVSGQTPIGLVISTTPDSCYQTLTGTISVVASGGTPGYTYLWSSGPTAIGSTVYSLGSGPYTVTVTDHNSCTATASGTINQPPQLTATMTDSNIACFGGASGTATVNASGGNGGYTYSWSPTVASTAGITGLAPNTYYVTVTDSKLCKVIDSAVITQPASAFTVTVDSTNVSCYNVPNGTITLVLSGGSTPYGTVNWSGGTTGTSRTGLSAGTYTFTVSDAHLCQVTGSVTLTQPSSAFLITPDVTSEVKCFGGSTGSVTLTPSGGTPPYGTAEWLDLYIGDTRSNLPAGTYFWGDTDHNGCLDTGFVVITQPASAFTVTPTVTEVSCFGNSTGSINLALAGGTTPYPNPSVTWRGSAVTGTSRTGLAAGTYSYIATDGNGCVDSATLTITQPASAFTVTPTVTNVSCFGNSTGSITLALAGGTTPYPNPSVTWRGSAVTGTSRTGLAAGTYSYIATDGAGCVDSATLTITQPASAFTVTPTVTNVLCFGNSTGSITLALAGGTTPYPNPSVTWRDGGATGTSRTGLAAGTYSYIATDGNGCVDSATLTITQPGSAFTVTPTITNVVCFSNSSGAISLTLAGGTTPYPNPSVTWRDGGVTGTTRSNLPAGTYSYIATDGAGCVDSATLTITQPATGLVVTPTITDVSCFGNNTGTISLSLAGGVMPYPNPSVTWRGSAVTGTLRSNLTAGTYSYIATDGSGCTDSATLTVTQPLSAFTVTPTVVNVACNGSNTGSITLAEAGGTTPYPTVTWRDGGATGTSRTNLAAGSYSYIATDANGCTDSATLTITQPASAFAVAMSQVNVLCYGESTGSITLTPSGGTTPYATAQWLDGFTGDMRNNLPTGTYYYADSDNNGCLVTGQVIITQPTSPFTVTPTVTPVTCFGGTTGSIILAESGGTPVYPTVTWRDGSTGTSRTNLAAGSYSYIATDANGCTDSATLTVTQPTAIVPVLGPITEITCNGSNNGTVVVTASGGTGTLTFEIDASGSFQATGAFTGLTPGQHVVTVQDANGCQQSITFNITQPNPLTITVASVINDSCAGACDGSVIVTATGGTTPYEYSIDAVNYFPSDTFKDLCANPSYTISVQDANQCQNNTTAAITQPTAVTVTLGSTTPPTCNNGSDASFTVSASGGTGAGYTYSLNGTAGPFQASGTFAGLTPGTYNILAEDANGCQGNLSVVLPNTAPSSSYTTVDANVSCFGGSNGSVTVNMVGTATPYSFIWSNGATTQNLTNLSAGSDTLWVTDVNGCVVYSTDSVNVITQPTQISAVNNPIVNVTCFGDSNGCITVTPSGGVSPFTDSWSNGATTANPCGFKAGTYTDTLTDANGCQYIDAGIVVTQPAQITIALGSVTLVSCPGDSNGAIQITASNGTPGYTYSWSPGGGTGDPLTGVPVGSYSVTVTDANHCTATDSVTVGVNNPLSFNASLSNVLCPPLQNGSISLTVSGGAPGYQYMWSNGATTSSITNLNVGIDSVTVTDSRGCTFDTGFVIINDSAFSITINPDTATIDQGTSIQLPLTYQSNGGGTPSYSWTPPTGLSCTDCPAPEAAPFTTTQYMVTATTDLGCIATASMLITVIPQHQLYVPNAFTPNGDGVNDYWEAFGKKTSWTFCSVSVFDRWGEKVFESQDINFQWDGKYKGTYVEPGEFVYALKVVFVDGNAVENKGTVTVIR